MSTISELSTHLIIIKKNLLQADLFPGCIERCYCCVAQLNGCKLLKEGIQRLMDNHMILFEKTPSMENLFQDLELEEVFVISETLVRITSKGPSKITTEPRVFPLIITASRPIPYSSNKVIPWNYGADIYYHGIKQESLTIKEKNIEVTDPDVGNIAGTSKVTRSGRFFSPEISPKTVIAPVCIITTE